MLGVAKLREEFDRTVALVGKEGLEKLHQAAVAVFGIGGVGSFAAEALARAGVGKLILVDPDLVERSNINRQLHATQKTIGFPKVLVMKERILSIVPWARVVTKRIRYQPQTASMLLNSGYSYIVDAMDDVLAKVDLIARARQMGIPLISSMGAADRINVAGFRVLDISETSGCPLARQIRRGLRRLDINSGVKVVSSAEPIIETTYHLRELENKPRLWGSISFVPPVVGLLMVGECIRDLLNMEGRTV